MFALRLYSLVIALFLGCAALPAWSLGQNVALSSNGGTATASSTYSGSFSSFPVTAVNNGDRKGVDWGKGGGWNDATASGYPDWVQITFNGVKRIDEIDIFTLQDNYTRPAEPTSSMVFTRYGLVNFGVQYWNGRSWITVPGGNVINNNLVWRKLTFTAITTDRIRVLVTGSLARYSRVVEIEAYEASGQGNALPTVSLTTPTNGSAYTAPATITLNASATDSDGSIAKVEFYNGATLLNTDTAAPYSYAWSNVTTGGYALTAKAYDNVGASTVSSAVSVTVKPSGGSSSLSGVVDSSLIANLKQNAIYIYAGNVTPDDLGGTGALPLKLAPVAQANGACGWGYNAGSLADGQYTLAFTNQADNDNPATNDVIAFQRVTVIDVVGGAVSHNFTPTRVLTVGLGKTYPNVKAAAAAVQNGDVVEIDAAQYNDNIVVWRANDLTLRGVGGRAHMHATKLIPYTSGNDLENGKGLWVTRGANIKVENIEFSGASVADKNGAGIRAEGANLSVCNSYFHDNETGILGGAGQVLIEYSEFANNGGCTVGAGCAHNLYITNTDKLVFRHNYSHHAKIGHLLKSRAKENHILYNRLTGETGTASYEVDIPDGGLTYLVGNLIQQGVLTDNSTMVAYAAESASNPIQQLYAVNNTLVNENGSGTAISIRAGTTAQVINNLFVGNGNAVSGPATQTSNVTTNAPNFVNQTIYDYRLTNTSPGMNSGSAPGTSSAGFTLAPIFQYLHPSNREARTVNGALDIGAYEFAGALSTPVPTVTLNATPASVNSGASSTLTWSSTNATSCAASGAWSGSKATSGSQILANLTATGSYTLTCTGTGGSTARSTSVTVNPVTGSSLTVGETAILGNNDSGNGGLLLAQQTALTTTATLQSLSFYVTTASGDLRLGVYDATGPNGGPGAKKAETNSITPVAGWNTVNVITPVSLPAGAYWLAYTPSSSNLVFKMEPSGSAKWVTYPYGPMPATFSATPISGAYHWSLYATFNTSSTPPQPPAPLPTVTLSANPISVSSGGAATLTWSSTNTISCTASGAWSGSKAVSGNQSTGALNASASYTLTCTGAGGSASRSATVTVTQGTPAPTVSLSASPANVASGGSSTLTWSSTNATSCTASGAWSGSKAVTGTQTTGALSASSSYTLTCTGAGGSTSRSAAVTVTAVGGSPLDSLQPGQWYMAPNSNVSALDPCPARTCSYSGSDGQAHVMGAWNSGAYDTKRDRLIIWGGGHNNYGGNEIYTFDIATMAWARITEPSVVLPQDRADCFPAGVAGCVGGSNSTGYYSDGKPASRHTANSIVYAANVDLFFSLTLGSSFGSTGRQGFDVDSFNFNTGIWKTDWLESPGNLYGAAGTIAAYNPVTGKIWYHAAGNSPLAEFDPTVSPTGSWRASTVTTPNNGQAGVLMDYKRNRMVAIGEYGGSRVLRMWDLNNINTSPVNQPTSGAPGGIALESARGVGFIYDSVGDRYVAWHGGAAVYALDPVTWVWSAIPLYSGNAVTPTLPNNEGTYGRMQYIPSKQVFILVNQTTENVYFFKLGAASTGGGTPAPTVTLGASPTTVSSGTPSTLSWSSTNATNCTASGAWSGSRAIAGAEGLAAVSATSTYTLTCVGAGGSASRSVTVTVTPGTPAPTVTLNANPASVASGGTSTLVWSSTNATSCTATGAWSGSKATSGNQSTGVLNATSTYTLSCTGAGGSASQSVSVSVGTPSPIGLITSVQMVNNSGGNQTNAPVTFGHAFKQGDVPTGFTVIAKDNAGNAVALQVDKKATHADGSLRHAILTAKLANLPAAATQTLSLYTQANSASAGPVSLANLLATSFDSQVSLNVAGVDYTASARNLLQTTPPKSWLAGPEVSEWIVGGPVKTAGGVAHPHLTAYFHVRAYAGTPITKVRVDAVVENNWTFKAGATAFTYIPAVTVGSTTIYNNGGANLTHYHHTRWHQVGWWNNTDSKIFVKPDTRYLRDSKAVPNYASVTPQENLLNAYTQSVVPMTVANLRPVWSPGGAHAQIGLMPEWYASYVMSNGDIRAYNAVLANDSAGGAFSYHYRDENTGLPVSIDTYPNISEQDTSSLVLGTGGNPNQHDGEHQPLIGYLAYLLTGDYYYLEEVQFLANWGMLWRSAGSRGGSAGIIGGGSPTGNREIAWAVRTQAAAGAITPSESVALKAYFVGKANNNFDKMAAEWGATSPNTLGIRLDIGYSDAGYYAPWQMDFLVSVVNFAVDLGYASPNSITLRNTFNKWPTGRMGQDNSGYCPYYAALYNFGNDVSDRGVISGGVYRTFAQLYQYKFPAESAQPCPTSGVMRSGYGGVNAVDYYSNVMQAALAMAVDSGVATHATWSKFLSIAPADYSLGGTWGIVPRSGGSATVPNVTLVANPSQVVSGGSTSLSWAASNAVSCTAPWTSSQATSGSQTIANITSATTYRMTCTGAGGSSTQAVTVSLGTPTPTPTPPTVTFSADTLSLAYNASTTLRWSSTNAASCTASGAWSGSKATAGSQILTNLTATGTYTLTCTGTGGSTARSTTVTVTPVTGSPLTVGETAILGNNDSGNGGLLLAQQTALTTPATLQSLSFYVTTASGDLRLGVYDATGPNGGPGAKKAETNSITPVAGWNTLNVITPVPLPAGTYWLAYSPSSSNLVFKMDPSGSAKWVTYPYGPMPATFSATPISGPYHWSLYATFNTSSTLPPPPPAPLPR